MIYLIDSDIITYRAGFAAEKRRKEVNENTGEIEHFRDVEPESYALHNVRTIVDKIRNACNDGEFEFYLTGKGNFRFDIATIQPYKGNRSPLAKPVHYKAIRKFITEEYNAKVIDGMEADDAIGIRATDGTKCCIVTIDKDLDMIPGPHFSFVKQRYYEVNERDGYRSFYRQVLTGDRTDNIRGIDGIGDVRASKIIDQYNSERAMWQAARYCWHKECPDGLGGKTTDEVVNEVAALLWIARTGRERWTAPK